VGVIWEIFSWLRGQGWILLARFKWALTGRPMSTFLSWGLSILRIA
jgi:hypothetical protein